MREDDGRRRAQGREEPWLADWDEDQLLEAFGRLNFDVADALREERFLDWLAQEARERSRNADRRPEREWLERGAELVARMHERSLRIQRGLQPRIHVADAGRQNGKGDVVVVYYQRRAPFVDLGVAAGVGRELWDEMPDQWIEVPASLPDANYVALRIVGDSMTPLIHSGDTVLVKREPAVIPNTMVVARHPDDGYVCKKVERLTATDVVLASLAPDGPRVVIPRDPRLIIGTVVMIWCTHRSKK